MKILLIAPASGKWRHVGRHRFLNGRTFRFSLLSLLSVAAESPPDADVRIVDEQVDDIPWDADVDLVGITCMTALAPRAYEIARRFRERRIPVVLGGMHPTLCPEEAVQHADAIVVGEAEGIWHKVVADASDRRLTGDLPQRTAVAGRSQASAPPPAVGGEVRPHRRRAGDTRMSARLRFLRGCRIQQTYSTASGRWKR